MSRPTFLVETSLTTDPLATPSWTDQVDYVDRFSFKLGRDSGLGSEFQPAEGTVVLINDDRRFDPEHAAGPNYGNLLPGKRLRIRATHADVVGTKDLFAGFVGGWPQQYEPPSISTCPVPVTDGLPLLNRDGTYPDALQRVIAGLSPTHWWKLGDAANSEEVADSGSSPQAGLAKADAPAGLGTAGLVAGSSDTALTVAGADHAWVDVSGVTTWTSFFAVIQADEAADNTHNRVLWDSQERRVFIHANSTGDPGLVNVGNANPGKESTVSVLDGLPHTLLLVKASGTSNDFKIYIDGVDVTGGSGYSPLASFPSATESRIADRAPSGVTHRTPSTGLLNDYAGVIQHVATFDSILTATDAAALHAGYLSYSGSTSDEVVAFLLDQAGWPSADRDLDTGLVTLGDGATFQSDVLEDIRTVEASEGGQFYQAPDYAMTFRNRTALLTSSRSTTSQWTLTDEDSDTNKYHYNDLVFDEQGSWIRNIVRVTWVGGEETAVSSASVDAYGPRDYSVETVLPTAAQARNLAEWILDHYAEPAVRISSVVLNPGEDDRLWKVVLDLQIGDRLTVVRHPQEVGTAISQDVLVEGIEWNVAGGGAGQDGVAATVVLSLSTADTQTYWIWGTSEWGSTKRWS